MYVDFAYVYISEFFDFVEDDTRTQLKQKLKISFLEYILKKIKKHILKAISFSLNGKIL